MVGLAACHWLCLHAVSALVRVCLVCCSLYESLVCNEYVNDLPGPSLLPEDAAQRARARLLIDQVGVPVSP